MKEKMNFGAMLKLGFILAVYSTAACVGLAFVYSATGGIIEQRRQADLEAALRELFPDADSFKAIIDIKSPDNAVVIEGDRENPANTGAFAAVKNGRIAGVALRTSRASYSGPVVLMTGVGPDGRIRGVKILELSDTPGLGANAASKTFYVDKSGKLNFLDQFRNKSASDPFVPKQDIAAITAATITSAAVSSSVKIAGEAAVEWMRRKGEVW